jgi:ligand-binding sensor domain-containing protein
LERVPHLKKSEKIRRAILETQEGPVWINDDSGFMLRLNGRALRTLKEKKAGKSEIWAIQQAADGRLWAGGRNGLWENPDHMGWHLAAGRRKGISDVQCLAASSDGTLWIGMESSGLAAWKNDEILRWSTDAGLPNPHVTALCIDKDDDSVWIGSCGNGLISFRDGVFREVPFTQNIVSHIMDDGKGRLWVVGEQGLAIVEKKEVAHALSTGEEIQTYILYGEEEGLNPPIDISSGLSTACLTPDGRFWYASDRQLSVFQP